MRRPANMQKINTETCEITKYILESLKREIGNRSLFSTDEVAKLITRASNEGLLNLTEPQKVWLNSLLPAPEYSN